MKQKQEVSKKTYMNYILNNSDLTSEDIKTRSEKRIKDIAVFIKRALKNDYKVMVYSGRGMYGMKTIAVDTCNINDAIADLRIKGLCSDNMGLGYIVYIG